MAVRHHCDIIVASLRCRHAVTGSPLAGSRPRTCTRPETPPRRRPRLDDGRLAALSWPGLLRLRTDRFHAGLGRDAALVVRAPGVGRQRGRGLRRPMGSQADDGRDQPAHAVGLLPLLLVSGADRIWLVYAVLAAQSCVEVFFAPAEQAFLPRVVDDADLVAANGLNGQVRNMARLVGSGLGGVTAAAGGIRGVAVADALTFLLAAVLVLRISEAGRAAAPADVA